MNINETVQKEVDVTYRQIGKIAKDLVQEHTKELDTLIKNLINIENQTDSQLRDAMLKISCLAYQLAEIKEHASLRADCSTALLKEKQALEYQTGVGTQQQRQQQSVLASQDNVAVQILYNGVSKLFASKVDEAHRIVNTLNAVLIGRMSAQKRQQSDNISTGVSDEEVDF